MNLLKNQPGISNAKKSKSLKNKNKKNKNNMNLRHHLTCRFAAGKKQKPLEISVLVKIHSKKTFCNITLDRTKVWTGG